MAEPSSPQQRPTKWTGEDSSSGVYYWLVAYRTCAGDVKTLKGFVQLMR